MIKPLTINRLHRYHPEGKIYILAGKLKRFQIQKIFINIKAQTEAAGNFSRAGGLQERKQ